MSCDFLLAMKMCLRCRGTYLGGEVLLHRSEFVKYRLSSCQAVEVSGLKVRTVHCSVSSNSPRQGLV